MSLGGSSFVVKTVYKMLRIKTDAPYAKSNNNRWRMIPASASLVTQVY
jgi:hypothetical protein